MLQTEVERDAPILMVDDHDLALRLASICHQKSESTRPLVTFQDGTALLAYLDRVERGAEPMPHRILIDIRMPEIDGFALAQAIRARPSFADHPALAFLTTSEYPPDRDRAQALACGYHVKPIDIGEYIALFQEWSA